MTAGRGARAQRDRLKTATGRVLVALASKQIPDIAYGPKTGFSVTLPYPPSVNHLWRRVGAKTLLSAEGREYREKVGKQLRIWGCRPPPPPHDVSIRAMVPDRRKRDIDNIAKALLDAAYKALGVDDSVIIRLVVEKYGPNGMGGSVVLTVATFEGIAV